MQPLSDVERERIAIRYWARDKAAREVAFVGMWLVAIMLAEIVLVAWKLSL